MTIETALSFAGLCLLLSISPGPDSLLVLRLALNRPREGIFVAAGSAMGSLLWACAVAVGLARLLAAHPGLVDVLHFAGGAYLIYLGIREVFDTDELLDHPGGRTRAGTAGFTKGLVSCLLNPKVGLFFLLLAPQYAPNLTVGSILALGAIDAAVAFLYLTVLAIAAARIFTRVTNPRTQRRLRVGSGAAIAIVGVFILVQVLT
ncbi:MULTISPECIES: LysE family translocator [Mycobacteriaceae]|uniref:LysE family translocator n=1 Tax=Mycobacteriaceae TaxID=1762 RepID=UPI0002F1E560|nr:MULTISPECIES: LysE family translocator [Mycobacteriaceae]AHC23676.2 lysine exporter protein LysE/YggA [Mycolicibacterium neoaurum VKM Ac-1815D]AMO04358.1 lysine exporter protein LysE/YggA [Mycolicibacterium neoaurum]AXK77359.1 LysE family translocator [Mycolicibacterium neoaurum]KJQ48905.1 lysine exporter protein LysE/YggA [Mycolicibacterium neoaurum]KUM07456.1 lysine transporter LysE [Mycolicibacterium neoaurum]